MIQGQNYGMLPGQGQEEKIASGSGTAGTSGTVAVNMNGELATISVSSRIPEFWLEMPRLWFAQLESVLDPQKLGDKAKYDMVISKLSKTALQQVSDILLSPPDERKYQTVKNRLLEVYEESAERQFQKLVSEMELGAQKPSQLLRKMRELGRTTQISEQALLNLWLQRLPSSVRAVLTVSQDQNLENLANIADKIMDMKVSEISEVSTSAVNQFPVGDIVGQMHKLTLEVASLRQEVNEHRRNSFRGRRGFNNRSRSRSRSRQQKITPQDPRWLCKFHYRYRSRARNCEKPCAWISSPSTSEN